MAELLKVDPHEWADALLGQREYFEKFGDRLPTEMWDEHHELARRLHL
jgi:phosphoenolpyruvate carboxykinase (GTP)